MTLQELGSVGEFVGAFVVVISLFYLAAQIRQNTRAVRTAAFQDARLFRDSQMQEWFSPREEYFEPVARERVRRLFSVPAARPGSEQTAKIAIQ